MSEPPEPPTLQAGTSSPQQSEPGGTRVGGAHCISLLGRQSPRGLEGGIPTRAQHSHCSPQPAQQTSGIHRPPDRGPPLRDMARVPTQITPHQAMQPPAGLPHGPVRDP
ncbi:hypothetical protein ATANTOWER_011044 [Ataeniobius toweri]|uniref:Uncharacterized protein n=1 Tax=Ataeniobius toweri TaxID=208326 RepID=A0ABU7BUG8_9TELE|nr:hypothetical protein [Ataeniobius toweri]